MRPRFRLFLVTDRRQCAPVALVAGVDAALRGGVEAVQLREKDLDGGALLRLAAEILPVCRRHGAPLLINDRIDVALSVDADGVHLPADSFPVAEARRLLGNMRLIGVSTHSAAEVAAAHAAGADYAVIGPVFATPSKAEFGPPLGLEELRAAAAVPIPVFAIGGITPPRIGAVRAAGASGIAVISAVLAAADPAAAAAELHSALAT